MQIVIKGQLETLNDVINANRSHWSRGAALKKQETELVQWQVKSLPPITKPAIYSFDWFISTNHDPDNISSAKKFILDGLIQAGKLPNDNQKWVLGFGGETFSKVAKGQEKVVVTIDEVE